MKKLFGAIIVATMIFGAVFASASALNVTGGTIQNGMVNVTCQQGPIAVSYKTQVNGSGVNEVTDVTLSGVEGACYTKSADIALIKTKILGSGVSAYNIWGKLDSAPSTTFHLGLGGSSAVAGDSGSPLPLSSSIEWVNVQIADKS
ncbi:MAG: hypothetical protein ACYDAN_08835 [Candidatus Limnocylindrales bacterium]